MKNTVLLIIATLVVFGCIQPNSSKDSQGDTAATVNNKVENPSNNTGLAAYNVEAITGSKMQHAYLNGPTGMVSESGHLLSGKKTGTWVTNHPSNTLPAKIISFVNGKYNGLYLELNDRGQIEVMANYKNNILEGPWTKMKLGRPIITATYKEGLLNGLYQEFEYRNGKIKKEVTFKKGKENGAVKFFDEKGNVTVEYLYKDGEKISGGIVE